MPEPVTPDDLDAAERYILVEVVEERAALWELAFLHFIAYYGSGPAYVFGPGADIKDAGERLHVAKRAAQRLLAKGLVDVETGPDWFEEGERLAEEEAMCALSDDAHWAWSPRDTFVWLVPTPAGEEVAELVPGDPGQPAPSRRSTALERLRRALACFRT